MTNSSPEWQRTLHLGQEAFLKSDVNSANRHLKVAITCARLEGAPREAICDILVSLALCARAANDAVGAEMYFIRALKIAQAEHGTAGAPSVVLKKHLAELYIQTRQQEKLQTLDLPNDSKVIRRNVSSKHDEITLRKTVIEQAVNLLSPWLESKEFGETNFDLNAETPLPNATESTEVTALRRQLRNAKEQIRQLELQLAKFERHTPRAE